MSHPVPLNHLLYVISKLEPIQRHFSKEESEQINQKYPSNVQKHLSLLCLIALVLITNFPSDVAATTMRITPTAIKLYFCKNTEATPEDLRYYQNLLKNVQDIARGTLLEDPLGTLMRIITDGCQAKMRVRFRKFTSKLREFPTTLQPPTHTARSFLQIPTVQILLNLESTDTDFNVVWPSLSSLLQEQSRSADLQSLKSASILCYYLSITPNIIDFMGKDALRRCQKFGDYYKATKAFVSYAQDPHWTKALQNATIEDVWTIERCRNKLSEVMLANPKPHGEFSAGKYDLGGRYEDVAVSGSPSTGGCGRGILAPKEQQITIESILGAVAAYKKMKAPNHESIKTSYPWVTDLPRKLSSGPATRHYECHLVRVLTLEHPDWNDLEIGISKEACYLCHKWLKAYGGDSLRIHSGGTHGIVYQGWDFIGDSTADLAVYTKCMKICVGFLQQIKAMAERGERERSDSIESRLKVASNSDVDEAQLANNSIRFVLS